MAAVRTVHLVGQSGLIPDFGQSLWSKLLEKRALRLGEFLINLAISQSHPSPSSILQTQI